MFQRKFWVLVENDGLLKTYLRGHMASRHSYMTGGLEDPIKPTGMDEFGNKLIVLNLGSGHYMLNILNTGYQDITLTIFIVILNILKFKSKFVLIFNQICQMNTWRLF
jgi:hypothetical protein